MYAYRLSLKKDVIRYKSEASQRSVKRRRIEYLIFLRLRLDLFGFFFLEPLPFDLISPRKNNFHFGKKRWETTLFLSGSKMLVVLGDRHQ